MKIAVTYTNPRQVNYVQWLEESDLGCACATLIGPGALRSVSADRKTIEYHDPAGVDVEAAKHELLGCSGLILTGGVDMHPRFYGSSRSDYPNPPPFGFFEACDEFELSLLELALKQGMPVLAICRGMQLANVHLGGDLVQDLEEIGRRNHRSDPSGDPIHSLRVEPGTFLHGMVQTESGTVNTAHHQAVGKLGAGLRANCFAEDGTPEGLEWTDAAAKPWFLGIQWHAERMVDRATNPLSSAIRKSFLDACCAFSARSDR